VSVGLGGVRAMEFQEVIGRRHMVRRFTDDPVTQHSLERILQTLSAAHPPGSARARRSSY
jgi:nitroreductase